MSKIALVTGGTSGIGKAIAIELLNAGNTVIICYHENDANAKQAEQDLSDKGDLRVIKCDISDETEVIEMFNAIKKDYQHLDYLVNNAGMFIDSLIKDFNMINFKKVFDVNFFGKVLCTKHAYKIMCEGGSIVNISSHLGVIPCTESSAYCSAASAIINFTKATALEFATKKIRANSICPSFTPTPLSIKGWTKNEIEQKLKDTPLGRLATPEDTAKLCLFLLSDDASFITGENIWLNGGRLS